MVLFCCCDKTEFAAALNKQRTVMTFRRMICYKFMTNILYYMYLYAAVCCWSLRRCSVFFCFQLFCVFWKAGGGSTLSSGGLLCFIFISISLPVITTVSLFFIEYSFAKSRLPSPALDSFTSFWCFCCDDCGCVCRCCCCCCVILWVFECFPFSKVLRL